MHITAVHVRKANVSRAQKKKPASSRTTRVINLCHSRRPALVSLRHLFLERSAAGSYSWLSDHAPHRVLSPLETDILIFFRYKILVHLHPFSSTFALHLLFYQFWKKMRKASFWTSRYWEEVICQKCHLLETILFECKSPLRTAKDKT